MDWMLIFWLQDNIQKPSNLKLILINSQILCLLLYSFLYQKRMCYIRRHSWSVCEIGQNCLLFQISPWLYTISVWSTYDILYLQRLKQNHFFFQSTSPGPGAARLHQFILWWWTESRGWVEEDEPQGEFRHLCIEALICHVTKRSGGSAQHIQLSVNERNTREKWEDFFSYLFYLKNTFFFFHVKAYIFQLLKLKVHSRSP